MAEWKVTIRHHLINNQVGQEALVDTEPVCERPDAEWNVYTAPEHLPTKSLLTAQGKTLQ